MNAQTLLDEANACHDDDPARGADLLRRVDADALDASQLPLLAFLFNHVLGAKLGDWPQAQIRTRALVRGPGAAPAVLRHAAVAASLAGDATAASALTSALAAATATEPAQAAELVATFGPAGLTAWFNSRVARNAALALRS